MKTSTLLKKPPSIAPPDPGVLEEILPNVELIESDGEPMETDWHVREMVLLVDSTDAYYFGRDDYYVGGNMFLYFSEKQARNRDFRGPDYFFVAKTHRLPIRKYWCVWQEDGRTPNAVIELTSPSTFAEDHGAKKDIYEQILKVGDYFCYDPESEKLEGWRLHGRKYKALRPDGKGRLWSEELQLWLGKWQGKVGPFEQTWLRFFDKDDNLVLTRAEAAEKKLADSEAELARLRTKLNDLEGKDRSNGNGKRRRGH